MRDVDFSFIDWGKKHPQSMEDILQHLTQINPDQRNVLDSAITFQKVTVDVHQMSTGRAPFLFLFL